jgi:hypothetical protein
MNILMINPTHPATPHISAVRAWRFSQELSRRGHRVMLLTGTPADAETAAIEPLLSHDWSQPFVLVCGLTPFEGVTSTRNRVMRRARTAVRMLRHGGRQGAWVRDAVRAVGQARQAFAPDVVWCTCGMLESAFAARRIAAQARCPWVLDVKDNWESLVPKGIRHLMTWRIRGWTAMTANARLNSDLATKWQGTTPSVIYSGVELDFFPSPDEAHARPLEFSVNLVGSIYSSDKLGRCFEGLGAWFEHLAEDQRSRVTLRYIGGDAEHVAAAARRHLPQVALHLPGYLPVGEMARLCKAAAANIYIANPSTFHHKLLELLACGRTVIAFPSERQESTELATALGGGLVVANSPEAVASILTTLHASWQAESAPAPRRDAARHMSWPAQAGTLEQVLSRVVDGQP